MNFSCKIEIDMEQERQSESTALHFKNFKKSQPGTINFEFEGDMRCEICSQYGFLLDWTYHYIYIILLHF